MYLFRCATCETIRVEETLADAQATFNEHAIEQHESVMERVDELPATEASASDSDIKAIELDLEEPVKEGFDSR